MTQTGVNQVVNFGDMTARSSGVSMAPSLLNESVGSCYAWTPLAVQPRLLSPDFESLEFTVRLPPGHLHVRDGAGHSTVDIRQECIQFLAGPLAGDLDAAICQITHETGHLECPGDNERGISKTDSLDIATIKHLAAFLLCILDHPAGSPDQNLD
jgi:hypothetical protein